MRLTEAAWSGGDRARGPGDDAGKRPRHAARQIRLPMPARRVLDRLAAAEPRTTAELAREAGVSAAVIRGMADVGLLLAAPLPAPEPFRSPGPVAPRARRCRRTRKRPPRRCATRSAAGRSRSRCWMASPARARPRSIFEAIAAGVARRPPGAGAAAGDRVVLAVAGAL